MVGAARGGENRHTEIRVRGRIRPGEPRGKEAGRARRLLLAPTRMHAANYVNPTVAA